MPKIGRNEQCFCGSGKKFKTCCFSPHVAIAQTPNSHANPSKKMLVTTLTGELFQPMRLYYIVHDKSQLESCFHWLTCMRYDVALDDWVVEYRNEAARLSLKVASKNVPKKAQPLIIAALYIDDRTSMLIDVRSIERAAKLIEFIHQYVSRSVAEITHAAIYNQLITFSGNKGDAIHDVDYDDMFHQQAMTVVIPINTCKPWKRVLKNIVTHGSDLKPLCK